MAHFFKKSCHINIFFKYGPNLASFLFILFLLSTQFDNGKSVDGVHGIRTKDCKLVVAEESTEFNTLVGDVTLSSVRRFDLGSGCGSIGRAVAYDTRGLRYEYILNICLLSTVY